MSGQTEKGRQYNYESEKAFVRTKEIIQIKVKSVLFECYLHQIHQTLKINVSQSHQSSIVYLFGITSLRLTRERIENRPCKHINMKYLKI